MYKICSICGKNKIMLESEPLICTSCLTKTNRKIYQKNITPNFIFKELSKFVIGQDSAKKAVSIGLATHFRRLEDPSIEKSNILIIGPTGTGKTEIARTISKLFGIPLAISDATSFTAHGYIGEDVESVLYQLMNMCDWDLSKAQNGIVFIDEIDKLGKNQEGPYSPQIGTIRVQQSLLKMMEGGRIKLTKPTNRKSQNSEEHFFFDTSKTLFICAGSFPGLDDYLNPKSTISLSEENKSIKSKIKTEHLIRYGFIPEFIGRLPIIVETNNLSRSDLIKILTQTENSLTEQYRKIMNRYGVILEYSEDFIESICEEALRLKTGARGLRLLMEERLSNLLFEGPEIGTGKIAHIQKDGSVIYKKNKSNQSKKIGSIS